MKYYIGIDGGGTKTTCVVADDNLNIISEGTGEPSNFLILGIETVSESILKLTEECLSKANISFNDIFSIVLGTAGAGRRSDAEKLEKEFIKYCAAKLIELKNFHVVSDAFIALEGAFSGNPGSILISGTGSIMFGKDSAGNIHRVSGFGRYIGDEGSGYMIGKKGLTAAAKAFDGRGSQTKLTVLLNDKLNIGSAESLIISVYREELDIASVAPLVLSAAEKNDPICLKIIQEETDELILNISTMAAKLNEPELNLSFFGGIIGNDNIFTETLIEKLKNLSINIHLKKPDYSPAMGAVLIARQMSF